MIDIFYLDGKKIYREKFSPALIKRLYVKNKKMWMDITDPKFEQVNELKKIFSLHPVTVEDMISLNTRTKIENFKSYLFVILYGIYKEKNLHLREMNFVLGNNYLITTHKKSIISFEKLKIDKDDLKFLFDHGMDFLMHKLIDEEIDNFIPALEILDDTIENIENQITHNPESVILEKILDLKRRVNKIKKMLIRQQEQISFLTKNKYSLISQEAQTYFRDVYDHFFTVTDMIEDYKDGLSSSFDAYMSSVSNKMNEVMKVLSVMATIMLPLSVISGIYGMNFTVIPGAKNPSGFWMVLIFMLIVLLLMVGYFRKKRWF